jgi:hypothetical protein
MKKCYFLIFGLLLHGILWGQSLRINEWMAVNHRTISGPNGHTGWIELYNAGTINLNLGNYYLSDDPANLTKYRISPNASMLNIRSGQHFIIWMDGLLQNCFNCLQMSLNPRGGSIYITLPDGVTLLDVVHYDTQYRDISFGRTTDGGPEFGYFQNATPRRPNQTSVAAMHVMSPPDFEIKGGFFDSSFLLRLSHSDPDAEIFFTVDGSTPDPKRLAQPYGYKNQWRASGDSPPLPMLFDTVKTQLYNRPIFISNASLRPNHVANFNTSFDQSPWYLPQDLLQKGTVVRAVAYKNGAIASPIVGETYFVTNSSWTKHELPVVSIATANKRLFDYEHGLTTAGLDFDAWRDTASGNPLGNSPANWNREGIEHEIPISISVFNPDGERVINQEAGMRIHGGWTRHVPRKSFRLYARSAYGKSTFEHPFFLTTDDTEFKRLILRNSGNDFASTLFRDAFMQHLVRPLNFDIQLSQPAVLYLNGEYQGLYNIREFQNRHYIERKYGIQADQLDLLGNNFSVIDGTSFQFIMMLSYMVNRDLSQPEHIEFVKTLLDIPGFLEYIMAQVFIRNSDWPHNNVKVWRKRTTYQPGLPPGQDGRFRWMMYDTDHGFGLVGSNLGVRHNTLDWAYNTAQVGMMLQNLFENDSVKAWFGLRYQDLINSLFRSDHIIRIIDSMEAQYRPEIPMQIQRWQTPSDFGNWEHQVQNLRLFASQRGLFARQHLSALFNWESSRIIEVSVSDPKAGFCHVNTISLNRQTPGLHEPIYPWIGFYVPDVPITLSAHAHSGYQFAYWTLGQDTLFQDTIVLVLQVPTSIKAHFNWAQEDCPAELGFDLNTCPYIFDFWSEDAQAGTAPPNARFVYFEDVDPGHQSPIAGFTNGAYNLNSRTRIEGRNEVGVAFVNTGNTAGNPGYPGGKIGGLLLNLTTKDLHEVWISWIGHTHQQQSRAYEIRLQYRIGSTGPFEDLNDLNGFPMVYRAQQDGEEYHFPPVALPEHLLNRDCIQLLWRYMYTGRRRSASSGARDLLGISSIKLMNKPFPEDYSLLLANPDFSGPQVVQKGDTAHWHAHVFISGGRYQWSVENGVLLTPANEPTIQIYWPNTGMGKVTLEIERPGACRMGQSKAVAIHNNFLADEDEIHQLNLYPNPNNGQFKIALSSALPAAFELRVMDMVGRTLHEEVLQQVSSHELHLSLARGMYLLTLYNPLTERSFIKRFEVQ